MKDTVLVLGNGFDLDLGLKTSYYDFISDFYLNEKYERTNKLIDDIIGKDIGKDSDFLKDLRWIDLEKELRDYAISYIDKEISNYSKLTL